MSEQRLVDLETKFSFQDSLIEELRLSLQAQYLKIEKLEKNMKIILDQMKNSGNDHINTGHEKPPHY